MDSGIGIHLDLVSPKTCGLVSGFFSFSLPRNVEGLCCTVGCGLTANGGDTTDFGGVKISANRVIGVAVSLGLTIGGGLSAGEVGDVAEAGQLSIRGNAAEVSIKAIAVI